MSTIYFKKLTTNLIISLVIATWDIISNTHRRINPFSQKNRKAPSNEHGLSAYIIHISIATSANIPGIPKKPDTADVIKLIGIWMPNWFPSILRKNRKKAPITSFAAPWLIKRKGFKGEPLKKSSKMRIPKIATITIGSNCTLPFQLCTTILMKSLYKIEHGG